MSTKTAPLVAALAASLLLLAGCAGTGGTAQSDPSLSGGAPAVAPAPDESKGEPGVGVVPAADEASREVARTASVTLVVSQPLAAADRVRQVAARFDGWVTREDLRTNASWGPSSVVLSVPADRLDAVLAALAEVGTITNRSTTATDVTDRIVDVDARIRTLQDSVTRIRALMDRAGTVSEIAAVERELTTRQAELESLLAQQQNLRTKVDRTPVTVTLTTQAPADDNPFLEGLWAAWLAIQGSLRFLLVAAGAILPFAVVGGLLWFPLRAAFRRARASKQPPTT